MRIKLLLAVFFLLFCLLSHSQNIVLDVAGKVLVNGQPVKKGDNLANNVKPVFNDPAAELKVLSQTGICVIKYENYEQKSSSELLELIKSFIRKNSVATLGTRAWKVNPDKDKQVALVDSLCKTLNVTRDNVEEIFSQYITPYCVLEFETPYWQDIADFLQKKYGFNPPQLTGELMTAEQYQKIPLVPKVRSYAPLPPAASLKKYCPIPGNQGQYGTCTAWASAYGARTISWAIRNNLTDVSDITNQAFSPSFIYPQIKDANDYNCSEGSDIGMALQVLKNEGVVYLTDLPYQCDANPNPFYQKAKAYIIKDYQRLTYSNSLSQEGFDNIKQALANNKPVIGSIKCYRSFMNSWGAKVWNGVLDNMQGYHAICLIGYDDNFNNGDGTFGAVEIMNSWSPIWGNGGFIYVKYRDIFKILDYTFSLYDDALPVPPPEPPKPEPAPPPPPDPMKRMEGSFSLILSDGTAMQLEGDEAGFRGLKRVSDEKMTYNMLHSYPAGTMFNISFTSSQPVYVYILSTDSHRSPLTQLFPDPGVSALLDFKSEVAVTIPDPGDKNPYIGLDDTPGEDYMCVIYSKDPLDMNAISNSFQNNPDKSFMSVVKEALADKIVDDNEVTFEKTKMAFKSASATHTAVPVFIKVKHSSL